MSRTWLVRESLLQFLDELFIRDIYQDGVEEHEIWLMTSSRDQALFAGWRFQNLKLLCP
jgi:hypothetical protein